jgi:photosystem II stability/assembly factor-like uncharacterized protein
MAGWSWSFQRRGRFPRRRVWVALAILLVLSLGLTTTLFLRARQAGPGATGPASGAAPLDVGFVTADSGWLTVEGGGHTTVLLTGDGGRHWRKSLPLPANALAQVRFLDTRNGLVFTSSPQERQDRLYRTEDGGRHWELVTLPAAPTANSGGGRLAFADALHGWYLQPAFNSRTSQDFTLYRTADGGRSWSPLVTVDIGHPTSHGLSNAGVKTGLAFRDAQNGWIGQITPGQALMWLTHDGGASWEPATLPPPATGWEPSADVSTGLDLQHSRYPDAIEATVMSPTAAPTAPRAYLYVSAEGGRSWTGPRPLPEPPAGAQPSAVAPPVAFAGPASWWYPRGSALFESQDAGQQWRPEGSLPGGRQFARLEAVDASHLWSIAGRPARCPPSGDCLASWTDRGLLRTADGGRHWTPVPVVEGAQ